MPSLKNVKNEFPLLKKNPRLVYLDSAATSLKPQPVIDAIDEYYASYSANVHRGLYDLSEKATARYEGAREKIRGFINARSTREIIFTRGTTEAINIVAHAWGDQNIRKDDEIILSILEHHSNLVPWQMLAARSGARLKFIDCDERGMLKTTELTKLLNRRTKIIALAHVSNALGTINVLRPIIQKAHAIKAKVLIDAAQSVPHMPLDVQHLDCDFLAFSGHKMVGPTGIGILYAKEKILAETEPFFGGGDMIREVRLQRSTWNELPWKFEAGTPNIAGAIGLGAAVDFLQGIGMSKICDHGRQLLVYAFAELKKIPDLTLYGPADASEQSGVISFSLKGIHPHDIAAILNEEHIALRAGHHCCMPLMDRLKLSATARASFYLYNDEEDVEKLIAGIKKVQTIFDI